MELIEISNASSSHEKLAAIMAQLSDLKQTGRFDSYLFYLYGFVWRNF